MPRTKVRRWINTFRKMKTGHVVDITIWDGFSGTVKIIKNKYTKWLVEIVDVSMCYPQQVPLNAGKRLWIGLRDIYTEPTSL